MLMQAFKTALELDITDAQRDALIVTLKLMETGKLIAVKSRIPHVPHARRSVFVAKPFTGHFSMDHWRVRSGNRTICCIGGTAELVGGVYFNQNARPPELDELFYPTECEWSTITVDQAAQALRSYLTTGETRWGEICGSKQRRR